MSGGEPPAGLRCPGCQSEAAIFMPGQAWCGNEDCAVLAWDPAMTLTELAANVQQVRRREGDR